jgi:hypothetical protein
MGYKPDELALAVSGLGGIVGFLLLPTLGAWLRLLLRWLESDRSGLGPRRPIFGLGFIRATFMTFLLGFFFVSLVRSAGDLREVRAEAPVFGSAATGLVVGVVTWAVVALALSALRKDWGRRRQRGRGPALR